MPGPLFADVVMGIVTPSDLEDDYYGTYHQENLAYNSKQHQQDFVEVRRNLNGGSIVGNILARVPGYFAAPEEDRTAILRDYYINAPLETRNTMQAAFHFLWQFDRFRGPHDQALTEQEPFREKIPSSGNHPSIPHFLYGRTHNLGLQLKPIHRAA